MGIMEIVLPAVVSFILTAAAGKLLIPALVRLKAGQSIKEIGPTWHMTKQGTPTMGGLMFIVGIGLTIVALGWRRMMAGEFAHLYVYLFALVFGLIGCIDDYQKVKHHHNTGLTALQKFVLQLAAAVAFLCLMRYEGMLSPNLYIPFWNTHLVLPWPVYLIFAAFVIVGTVNAVNITDGLDVIEKAGGLHRFNGFDRPMLTDSGGFQVFSLAGIRKLREEGAEFRSHIDGSKHVFTPEKVMDIERTIGADIMMAFDECPPGDSDYEYAKKSLGLTHRWLDRCIQRFNETEPKYGYNQALFPIVQGCVYPDLRKQSAEFIASKGADGNAIGGLAVGEPVDKMYEMIEIVNEILPKDKPRYLMGVGTPVNILEGIERGVDMFDCVMPTRNGRNGMLFTKDGIINMRNKKWKTDFSPIEADGASSVDTLYSKAYLRHLFHAQELLAMQIASIHNLAFYLWLAGEARKHIIAGDFSTWKPMMVKRVSTRL